MDSPDTGIERALAEQERTISWLARKCDVSVSYAWKMIRGLRPLTPEFKAAAAAVLEQDADELFADIDLKAAS